MKLPQPPPKQHGVITQGKTWLTVVIALNLTHFAWYCMHSCTADCVYNALIRPKNKNIAYAGCSDRSEAVSEIIYPDKRQVQSAQLPHGPQSHSVLTCISFDLSPYCCSAGGGAAVSPFARPLCNCRNCSQKRARAVLAPSYDTEQRRQVHYEPVSYRVQTLRTGKW